MITLSWFIFLMPLAAAAVICFMRTRPRAAGWLGTGSLAICFLFTLAVLAQFRERSVEGITQSLESAISWIQLPGFSLEIGIRIDGLSLLMLLIVTGIGSLIFLYSTLYMEKEEGYARYFASLSLFAFSMLGIVFSTNLIQLFIFWELVGLSSYLLIGFWYEKTSAATAAKKAFLTTRIGDIGMMIGILLLFGYLAANGTPTFHFGTLEGLLPGLVIPKGVLTAICLFLFLGVVGKSAQLPLHVWLPDAMEGPTPVSALIHAATMVAAGVYLLARLFFLFHLSPDALQVIAWTGALTAVIPATVALVQNDIKKILAYSTLSQLGYMVMAMGLSNPEAGMFHLTTHAFFKALLFLGAGSLIHAMHTQDIHEMSTNGEKVMREVPVTSWTFLVGTAALMGIPPTSGFFSKEEILSAAQGAHPVIFILSLTTVFLTSFYMSRLCTIVFFRKSTHAHGHLHESGWQMALPLVVLAVLSAVAGFLPFRSLLPHGPEAGHPGGSHAILTYISLGLIAAGALSAFFIHRTSNSPAAIPGFRRLLEKKYFFDDFYDFLITRIQENLARGADAFEQHIVVETAVNGTARVTRRFGDILRVLQNGVMQFYVLVLVFAVFLFILILTNRGASA